MNRNKQTAVVSCAGSAARRCGEETVPACACGCTGCGECERVCPEQAVAVPEAGPARVSRDVCIGCGRCVKVCPQQIIRLVPEENTIQPLCSSTADARETRKACKAGCIGCGICQKVCPSGAIRVTNGHAVISQSVCIACGMCAASCPQGVIHDANGIFSAEESAFQELLQTKS